MNILKEYEEIILEEKKFKLSKINYKDAENLFNKGIVIYLKDDYRFPSIEDSNTLKFSKDSMDGAANIYMSGQTPKEYGFMNIIKWFEDKIKRKPLELYTLNSKEFLNLDYLIDKKQLTGQPKTSALSQFEKADKDDYFNKENYDILVKLKKEIEKTLLKDRKIMTFCNDNSIEIGGHLNITDIHKVKDFLKKNGIRKVKYTEPEYNVSRKHEFEVEF